MVVAHASRHRFNKNTFLQNGYCWTRRERRVVPAGNQRSIYLRISFIFSSVGLLVGRGENGAGYGLAPICFRPFFSYFELFLVLFQ